MDFFTLANRALGKMKSYFKPNRTVLIKKSATLFQSRTFQKKETFKPISAAKHQVSASQFHQETPLNGSLTVVWGKLLVPKMAENRQDHVRIQLILLILTIWLRQRNERSIAFFRRFQRYIQAKDGTFQGFLMQQMWWHRFLNSDGQRINGAIGVLIGILCTVAFLTNKKINALPKIKYGFELSQFNILEDKIKQGDIVYSMLTKRGLTNRQADSLLTRIKTSYNFSRIKVGKPYTVFQKKVETGSDYLVFEPDAKRYIVFDLKTPSVKEVKRSVSVREFETGGKLKKTLYSSLVESGMSYSLIDMVQEALKNKFDISQCEEGDEYKLIWEEELVDGRSVGVNTLKSVYVKGQCIPKPVYAFYFSNGKDKGWYEPDSLPVRDGFLDCPVKNSVITSSFNLNRFHPILHYFRPHYGTDYAAPRGTPIISVADGVVEEAKYGVGNGKYVKIKHKRAYETQYLHMSRFASGIEAGTPVKQKQVIGYVGSTGLATGPHVCFRFSKLGTPINHLTERIFSPMDSVNFKNLAVKMQAQLSKVSLLSEQERLEQKKMLAHMRGK